MMSGLRWISSKRAQVKRTIKRRREQGKSPWKWICAYRELNRLEDQAWVERGA